MRLLHRDPTGLITLTRNYITDPPPYAILSHTWGEEGSEVTHQDFATNTWRSKPGALKLDFCSTQAALDGLSHFWIDTCCIDKKDSVELQEAINSMFRWYKGSTKCYVYLSDVEFDFWSARFGVVQLSAQIRQSRWFTRGWTLQELIAPRQVEFFSRQRYRLGCQRTMAGLIQDITGIPMALLQTTSVFDFPINVRWGWATGRQTARPEDQAYCLWGIFDVHLPTIYGEGIDKALRRLKREIEDVSRERERYSSYNGGHSGQPDDFRDRLVAAMSSNSSNGHRGHSRQPDDFRERLVAAMSTNSPNGYVPLHKGGGMSNAPPQLTKSDAMSNHYMPSMTKGMGSATDWNQSGSRGMSAQSQDGNQKDCVQQ